MCDIPPSHMVASDLTSMLYENLNPDQQGNTWTPKFIIDIMSEGANLLNLYTTQFKNRFAFAYAVLKF